MLSGIYISALNIIDVAVHHICCIVTKSANGDQRRTYWKEGSEIFITNCFY